jgi:hypothetical protein
MPSVFRCPSERPPSPNLTNYVVVVDPHSMFMADLYGVPITRDVGGTATTVLVGEGAIAVPWSKLDDLALASLDPASGVSSKHYRGFNALLVDGSTHFIPVSGDRAIRREDLRALATRDGREAVILP